MKIALQILRKDFRHLWPAILVALALIFIKTFGWLVGTISVSNIRIAGTALDLGAIGEILMGFILGVVLVQSDLTCGDRAFWRTRPISPRSLFGAKVLFLCVALVLPAALSTMCMAISLDSPWRVSAAIGLETGVSFLAGILGAALLASVTRSLVQAVLCLLAVFVAVEAVVALLHSIAPSVNLGLQLDQHEQYSGSRIFTAGLFGCAALAGLLYQHFLARNTARTALLFVLALLAVPQMANRWSIGAFSPEPTPSIAVVAQKPSPDVQIVPQGNSEALGHSTLYIGSVAIPAETVAISAKMAPTLQGHAFEINKSDCTLRFADGEEAALYPPDYWRQPKWSVGNLEDAVCMYLGIPPPSVDKTEAFWRRLPLFNIGIQQAKAIRGKKGTLVAHFSLNDLMFQEEARLPAHAGSRWSHDGQAWRINSVEAARGGTGETSIGLQFIRAMSMIAPEGPFRPDYDSLTRNHGFVLLNRRLHQYSLGKHIGHGITDAPGMIAVSDTDLSFGQRRDEGGAMVPGGPDDAWLSDSELIILEWRSLGTTQSELTLENFEIPEMTTTPWRSNFVFWE
jgi:hypothetical protein